jgi:hypothetical protein
MAAVARILILMQPQHAWCLPVPAEVVQVHVLALKLVELLQLLEESPMMSAVPDFLVSAVESAARLLAGHP